MAIDRTRITLSVDTDHAGTGKAGKASKLRTEHGLQRLKEFIEAGKGESGAWRGTVYADRGVSEKNIGGVSGKAKPVASAAGGKGADNATNGSNGSNGASGSSASGGSNRSSGGTSDVNHPENRRDDPQDRPTRQ